MNTECLRIADQLRRAFEGQAWHGPSLKELLADVTAEQAHARPVTHAHSIRELISHIEVYMVAAANAARGVAMPVIVGTEKDWPAETDTSDASWGRTTESLFANATQLGHAIAEFGDARLDENVPGRPPRYNFYYLFHGIVQHSLYHGGQIALLKKSLT